MGSEKFEEQAKKKFLSQRKFEELENAEIYEPEDPIKVNHLSALVFFSIPDKHLKFLIPDYEQYTCFEMFSATDCHESYFGLARLLTFEGKVTSALEFLDKALNIQDDQLYSTWKAVLKAKTCNLAETEPLQQISFFKKLFCCSTNKRKIGILEELEKQERTVEILWSYLELSLRGLIETELPQHYAARIKEIDEYYGYLAFSEVYLRINDRVSAINLLQQVIRNYGNKPEAYVKLWNFYYFVAKDYNLAEDTASEALLKLNSQSHFQYYILFLIYTSKVYYKQKRLKECLGFLQRKFIEHPTYPVFLYKYGHLATKSEDFKYNGSAISCLQESLKLCSTFRFGVIYYWIAKAFMLARLHIDAYENAKLALQYLDLKHSKKINELKTWIKDIISSISLIERIEFFLSKDFNIETFNLCKKMCKEIQSLYKLKVDILKAKMLWKIGKHEKALKKLYAVCGITTSKMTAYFVLLDYLQKQGNLKCLTTVAHEMLKKSRHPSVPSSVWVTVNLIYAKILISNKKPGKAILMLKSLAKLLPPFPFADIPYTKLLQRARNIQDLTEASSRAFVSINAYCFGTYKNSFVETFTENRDFSNKLIEEEIQNNGKKEYRRRTQRLATENFEGFFGKKVGSFAISEEKKENLQIPNMKIADNADLMHFSICSDFIFLYKIAKTSLKYNLCLHDGILAIKDYIELLRFERDKVKQEKQRAKALMVQTLLYELSKQ